MKKGSAISAVLKLKLFVSFGILILTFNAFGQKIEHYNSPLYSPKAYDPAQSEPNGLPKVLQTVGIEQKLGNQLPLDTEFKDENGNTVKLGQYFHNGRPVILALVYYECPMLCNEVLNGLTGSLKGMSLESGKDFDVLVISFDARENDEPDLAKNKKVSYLTRYGHEGAENSWHFLTGTQSSIDAVTKAAGFNYVYDEKTNQFAHAGGIMIVTPDGKMARYFYGIDFEPRQLKLGILDSAQEKISSPTDQLLLFCYHYDPATGKYGFAILRVIRVFAVALIIGIAGMIFFFWRKDKQKKGLV